MGETVELGSGASLLLESSEGSAKDFIETHSFSSFITPIRVGILFVDSCELFILRALRLKVRLLIGPWSLLKIRIILPRTHS